MRGKEDYHTLKKCFKDVFIDINEIVMVGKIDVDGETVNLEFFLGGDYKAEVEHDLRFESLHTTTHPISSEL